MQKLVEMTGSLEKLTGVEEEEESGSSIHGLRELFARLLVA